MASSLADSDVASDDAAGAGSVAVSSPSSLPQAPRSARQSVAAATVAKVRRGDEVVERMAPIVGERWYRPSPRGCEDGGMADLPTLAVTGSTGALGGMVARLVADAGVPQRLLARDPGRAPDLAGAVPVRCAFADVPADALDGVEVLLMVSASESADRLDQHRAFVDAAARAGVRHLVYTSFVGAAADSVFTLGRDHYATEEHARALGLQHTFLRDNFYLDFLPMMVGDDGVLRGPAGEGRVAAVARADVARAAAAVLLDSRRPRGSDLRPDRTRGADPR